MNSRVAFPFLILSESAVSFGEWQVSIDGSDWTDLPQLASNWDYASTIRLRNTVSINPEIAELDLSIPRDQLSLAVGICIGSGQGRLPRKVLTRFRHILEPDVWVHASEFELPGRFLSSVLDLHTEITLASPVQAQSILAPNAMCSRLWANKLRLRLEGVEPRFPIETVDLATLLGDANVAMAPWYLHWMPMQWDRDFQGAVCLYLNEKTPAFLERINSEDAPIIQDLLAGVIGQICERFVLDSEAAEMMENAEPGSLAAQAVSWLHMTWPGKDAAFVRSVLENRPGVFHSSLLALAELGDA